MRYKQSVATEAERNYWATSRNTTKHETYQETDEDRFLTEVNTE